MNLKLRQKAFIKLGHFLHEYKDTNSYTDFSLDCEGKHYKELQLQIRQAVHHNGWFTKENVLYALQTWADTLTEKNIEKWVSSYDFKEIELKTIGVITAGNIPLVGFHDFISVLIAGHNILVKQSSNDQKLLPVLASYLTCIAPEFKNKIEFTEKPLEKFDAIIATGSNNTKKYFDYYFGKYPNITRMSRNGVAVLNGSETHQQLEDLGEDIFRYYGLGCRSISKIFIPNNYNFDPLFKALFKYRDIIDFIKYKNNYDYNKTIYLMSKFSLLENGFLVLKEETSYASPIATLFYEYYDDLDTLQRKLKNEKNQIQCIVSDGLIPSSISFGTTQLPQLWEYADAVDTLAFLLHID